MASVEQHYDALLSGVYSWMSGGFEQGIARNAKFFAAHHIVPERSGIAVDLGAGCGFQSIPLAGLGFSVTAIDLDRGLLDELARHPDAGGIRTVQDDLLAFDRYLDAKAELIVCMTDTILHLDSAEAVRALFAKVAAKLEPGGKFIVTFRDLSGELHELDRFTPVRSDDEMIFSCFLEYEPETVKVHDLLYTKQGSQWVFRKSFYRKLRLSLKWVLGALDEAGFTSVDTGVDHGAVTLIASARV